MSTLYIRDVPDDVTATLKERASASGQSLSAYLAGALTRLAATPTNEQIVERLRARDRSNGPARSDILAAVDAGRP